MEWSNDNVIEFLELLQYEPCLWNAKLKSNKNRVALNESWQRIIQSLSFPSTRDELKKKKDSLMGYYRIHLHKYKKSLKSGEDVYKTNWFAFELMDSFLRPVYLSDSDMDTVTPEEDSKSINESTNEDSQTGKSPSPDICLNNERKRTFQHYIPNQRFNSTPKTNHTKKNHDTFDPLDSYQKIEQTSCHREQLDEYDHFAFMIAAKVRKLENPDDREILMNSIQNVAFDFFMRNRQRTQLATSIKISRSGQSSPVDFQEK